MPEEDKKKTHALVLACIIVVAGLSFAGYSMMSDDDDDSGLNISEGSDEKEAGEVIDILLDSESVKAYSTPLVVEDDPYLVLAYRLWAVCAFRAANFLFDH